MEADFWYLIAISLGLVYIVPVLMMRAGLNRRQKDRRLIQRRVQVQHCSIEKRGQVLDRRQMCRRG